MERKARQSLMKMLWVVTSLFCLSCAGKTENPNHPNGTLPDWEVIGEGLQDQVVGLCVRGDTLFASTWNGELPGTSTIWQWSGTSWRQFGDPLIGRGGLVSWFNDELYVGGSLGETEGQQDALVRWNGASWEPIAELVGADPNWVGSMAVWHGEMYVGGEFKRANVAAWDGNALRFSPCPRAIHSLAIWRDSLIAVGQYGDVACNYESRLLVLRGNEWVTFAGGVPRPEDFSCSRVDDALVAGDALIIKGLLSSIAGIRVGNVARWDGVEWAPMGDLDVESSLLMFNAPDIYASNSDGYQSSVSKWDGASWLPIGQHLAGRVRAMAVVGGDLVVGGAFDGHVRRLQRADPGGTFDRALGGTDP